MDGSLVLREAGQQIWLDTLSRELLESGTLRGYIDDFGVAGVTSNPTILARELAGTDESAVPGGERDRDWRDEAEAMVYDWAIADTQGAADLFRPSWDNSLWMQGWVSLEVPPALAYRSRETIDWGLRLHSKVDRPNVFIKVPATRAGLVAMEELVVAGVPVNATLVFDQWHYRDVEDAYVRGLERRHEAGLGLRVAAVASVFVSRWDGATNPFLPAGRRNNVGLSMSWDIHETHLTGLASPRWAQLSVAGADPLRLVWASTSAKDPALTPTYYVERLPRAGTINTMPEATLLALMDYGESIADTANVTWTRSTRDLLEDCGIDPHTFAVVLQAQGVRAFFDDWEQLLESVQTTAVDRAAEAG
jgi:transaldolase